MQVFILEGYRTATGMGDDRKDRINRRKEGKDVAEWKDKKRERKLPILHS